MFRNRQNTLNMDGTTRLRPKLETKDCDLQGVYRCSTKNQVTFLLNINAGSYRLLLWL